MPRGGLERNGRAVGALVLAALTIGCSEKAVQRSTQPSGSDPLHASYQIDGEEVTLVAGQAEMPVAPGTAAMRRVAVLGTPVWGDLDGDGDADAAVLLARDTAGSAAFHVAAALQLEGRYRGTVTVPLGKSMAPQDVEIRNGMVVVNGVDPHLEGETTSGGRSIYLTLEGGALRRMAPLGPEEMVVGGWVTIGHEVRAFAPCSRRTDLWLLGHSPALRAIMTVCGDSLARVDPNTMPVFMTLAGMITASPRDGFGADYAGGFLATQLVRVWPGGGCLADCVVVTTPAPGTQIDSPLVVRGRARGLWFFEANFPMVLQDAAGNAIATGHCTARGEWMTEQFVTFEGTLAFAAPRTGNTGTLVLRRANPSDLVEQEDALEIPIAFR